MNKKMEKLSKKFASNWSKPSPEIEEYKALKHAYETGFKAAIESEEVQGLVEALEHCRPYMMDMVEGKIVNKALADFKELK